MFSDAEPILLQPILPAYDVVIPCHDRAHVVADAVTSVLAQDPAPRRVIVVDDGSADESGAAIRALAVGECRVIAVILPRNGGASAARNVGLALCTSPWVAFLDSDDVWLPGAARALLGTPALHRLDVVVGHFARVEAGGSPETPECGWNGGCIRAGLASGGVVGPSWSVIRRDVAVAVGGFDPSFHNCNDWDFYTRIAAAGARFGQIADTVALYRTVPGSRLVADTDVGAVNAARVLAHPYLIDVPAAA